MGKEQRHLKLVEAKPGRRHCTLFELVQRVQDSARGDDDVVTTIASLIESGRVVLSSNLACAPAAPESSEKREAGTARNGASMTGGGSIRFAR